MMRLCLARDPKERATIPELLADPPETKPGKAYVKDYYVSRVVKWVVQKSGVVMSDNKQNTAAMSFRLGAEAMVPVLTPMLLQALIDQPRTTYREDAFEGQDAWLSVPTLRCGKKLSWTTRMTHPSTTSSSLRPSGHCIGRTSPRTCFSTVRAAAFRAVARRTPSWSPNRRFLSGRRAVAWPVRAAHGMADTDDYGIVQEHGGVMSEVDK